MSLSSLPTEIVHQIIESTVPSTFHSTTYSLRQTTLRSLCLVSRLFRQLALPLLFEIVYVQHPTALNAALDSSNELSLTTAIQQAVLREGSGSMFETSSFESLASLCSSLKMLHVHGESTNVVPLSWFNNTEVLYIDSYNFDVEALALPRLRSLSLWKPSGGLMKMLTPERLPSLRALALLDYGRNPAGRLARTGISKLLPQLDILSLDIDVWRATDASFREAARFKTLVDCQYNTFGYALETRHVHNLRILRSFTSMGRWTDAAYCRELNYCADTLRAKPHTTLSRLVLESFTSTHESSHLNVDGAIGALVSACRERGIEVVRDTIPEDRKVDDPISQEMWRRQRERRRLEELE